MGFDNECIANIQSLPGEYFCPVCRTLIYPTEALQTQCTHLYCKPCLAHTAATTQACPYDGYLVTQADSKPLMELNKPLADAIGKVQVHCLYYRSSCQWQGTLSDCIVHCATCAYGNSPVLCNRCGTQIMHRQVQEHAQVCPVLPSHASQPVDPTQSQAATPATQFAGQNAYATPTAIAATTAAPVPTSTPEVTGQAAADQWYQQQYYQQYPGYDPYAQYPQQPQPQAAPVTMQPPQSQSAPQNLPPQPHLLPQQLQQHQHQPPQLQPLPQHPPLQPLPAPHSQLQLTQQGHNTTQSAVTGYSSYPQSQHTPTQQPLMHMPPPQHPMARPPSYGPPSQQMAAHQQLHPMGSGPHVPYLHGQALPGIPPMGMNHSTPPPPQFQPSPSGSLNPAFADETNGKIKEFLKERGSDDKATSKVGPISSRNTPPATLPHERYPPYGHSPDIPSHGLGQIRVPYNGSVRPYAEASMRPSMGTSPQTPPDAFDPIRWQPLSPFELPFSGPGMVRSNGAHAPLYDEGLRPYHRPPLEGLSRYERSSYPSNQPEFYGRGGPEYGRGPPSFRGPGRQEYDGAPSNKFGADYERSRPGGRSGARRFGDPVGYNSYGGPGHLPPENVGAIFPGGKGSSIERSRKRRFLTGGWCRICKIDCGTPEGLDTHSHSKDHKMMALDMIVSIKQQVSKNPKLMAEHEVADVKGSSDKVELDTMT